jgi:hypothetical protein
LCPQEHLAVTEDASEPTDRRVGFGADLRDAVSPRTVALVVGVLLLQLGFIVSYVGAFHAPKPHRISVALVAPAQVSSQLVAKLNALPSAPLQVSAGSDAAQARRDVAQGIKSAALVVDVGGTRDTLYTASAGGASVETAVTTVVTRVEASVKRTVQVRDLVPVQAGDNRGLTGFYLVIGWIVGGYLVAALLGVSRGARPANIRRAGIRLGAIALYAIASGLGGAVIVGPVLGALNGHLIALWWLGALLVFAVAAVTMAFEVLLGILGIGVTILIFVILGNPSAGGAYQPSVLPPFWRAISGALPNGAGTDAVRRIVYFDARGVAMHLLVLALYAGIGSVVALAASARRRRPYLRPETAKGITG